LIVPCERLLSVIEPAYHDHAARKREKSSSIEGSVFGFSIGISIICGFLMIVAFGLMERHEPTHFPHGIFSLGDCECFSDYRPRISAWEEYSLRAVDC
jgi:hypothetical protein